MSQCSEENYEKPAIVARVGYTSISPATPQHLLGWLCRMGFPEQGGGNKAVCSLHGLTTITSPL